VSGRLVIATANPDKLREIGEILSGTGLEPVPIGSLRDGWDVEETGCTLEENALLKARTALRETGLPAAADDTGLSVAALGGAPGVYSARYAGEACSYADNVRKLLDALRGETGGRRRAVFRTAAAAALPGGRELCVVGEVGGLITRQPRGEGGFGYDPVFLAEELGRTFAECTPEEKNSVSHRRRALQALREELERVGI
jgi:XTP/dITP diphosphohydrolase